MLEDFRDDTLCKWREWSRNEELSHDIGDKNWFIYQSIHPSIKINFWQMEGGKALWLKTNHPALSLPVNASQILTMNVVNRNSQYIDEKDRPFSSHWNKAGVKKVICEAKPIKSAFALILQQFHSDFFFLLNGRAGKMLTNSMYHVPHEAQRIFLENDDGFLN